MVGGSEENLCRAEPFILQMGKKAVHCGNIGAGQCAKICNNMLLAIEMIGVAEAFNLGERFVPNYFKQYLLFYLCIFFVIDLV